MGKEEAEANQAAAVRHLDGSTVEYRVPRGSDGEVLFTLVSTRLSIEEKDHFSLCFFDSEGVRHWLYNDKKIIRQLKGLPWQFSFEVKFYPTAPSTLSDDNARHNLFLQVQQEVNTGRIGVTLPTRALLSSFVAQSEFGDATASAEYETYLRSPHLADNNSDLVEKIREFHMQQKGMTESEAESKYLDVCKDLATYGVFMFPAKDAKDVPVKIGVCAQGINIYRHQIRAHRFSWQNVIKISYRRHYFAIKLKAGEMDKKETTLNFNLPSYEAAKRVWKCGVEHHTFFRLIQPEKKPKGSMFRLGSTPFRFQGRTQFQTKMASQMFDQHANTVRSPDSARHVRSLENMDEAGRTQSAIGVRSNGFSSPETMRSPEKTYMISEGSEKRRHHPEQVGASSVSFRYPLRSDQPLPLLSRVHVESTSSAAYYPNEQSRPVSLNLSLSPHYSQSAHSNLSPHQPEIVIRGTPFGRLSPCSDPSGSVRLLCVHSPVDPVYDHVDELERSRELHSVPLREFVKVYNPGYYRHLRTRATPSVPICAIPVYQNGDTSSLRPAAELDAFPLRYFADVVHSGHSTQERIDRERHSGEEDEVAVEQVNLSCYPSSAKEELPLQRLEKGKELDATNIEQYCSRYYTQMNEEVGKALPRLRKLPYDDAYLQHGRDQNESTQGTGLVKYIRRLNDKTSIDDNYRSEPYSASFTAPDSPIYVITQKGEREDSVESVQQNIETTSSQAAKNNQQSKETSSQETSQPTNVKVASEDRTRDDEGNVVGRGVQAEKTRFNWRSSTARRNQATHGSLPSTSDGYYSETSERYAGPVDTIDRRDELANLPLDVVVNLPIQNDGDVRDTELLGAVGNGKRKRVFLMRRLRHDGEEDVVAKELVKAESYGLPSAPYQGPLESTYRENDLEHAPLRDHASVYHDGQSWRLGSSSGKIESDKGEKMSKNAKKAKRNIADEPGSAQEYDKKEKVIYIAKVESPTEHGAIDGTSSTRQRRERNFELRLPHFDWRFGRKSHDREVKLAKDRPADDSAGSGNDSPSRSSSPTGRLFFVRRIRHDGDEDVVDKDHVALESYHLSSKSFDGPLDGLPREDDLEKLPLEEHANKYHDGQSWQRGKQKRKVLTPKDSQQSKETSSQEMSQPTDAKKENVLYITRVASEDRTRDGENNAVGHKSRLRLDFGLRWPSWRSGRSSHDGKHVDDVESSEAGSSRATSPRRQLYITRVRHDGDEDEVVQEDLKLASYELPGTPYEGPLEETHLENDLEIVPLGEHCTPYHSGLSYAAAKKLKKKKIKVTDRRKTIEQSEEKSEHEKQAASESGDAGRARVIYLAKVPDASVDEEITEDKRMQVEKTRFNWRFSTARRNQATHGSLPSTSDGYYSETSERYAGPVDTIDRRDELANLPLDVVVNLPIQNDGDVRDNELLDAVGNGKRKRVFLMRRLRHDGEEDVVAKELVKAESYGLPSAPYQGPLESTDRENDLEHASLRDHASVYHDGQSWRLGSSSGKIVSDKGEKMSKNAKKAKRNIADEPGSAQEYDKTEKVIYIAKVESPTEHGATDGTSSTSQRRERNFELRLPHFDWRFGRKSHDREVKLAKDRPADDSAGSGNDSPSRSSSPTGRLFFVRRIRHDGDEDVVDKDHVALESYHLSSKSFDGPLDGLPREDDLEKLPLEEHANKYHDGQSWQRGKQTRKVLTPKDSQQSKETSGRLEETHLENDLEIVPLGKHYTPYHSGLSYAEAKKLKKKKIKVTDRSKTIEQSEEKSEHEKQAASESGDAGRARVIYLAKVPDASVNEEITEDKRIQVEKTRFNWRSSTARRNQATHGSLPSTSDGYYSETSERYAGPVDTIDRRDELANLPLDVVVNLPIQNDGDVRDTELLGAVGNGKRKRVFLMRRLRHDGEEDVVAKELVKAESYGLPSAPYQGPLESTYRENDLEHAPLRDHASVYHDGQSWRLGSSSGKIESDKGEKMSKNAKKAKRNIADEPGSAQEYDKKEKVIYIAKVESPTEHGAIDGTSSTRQRRERNFELRLPHFDWRFGRKSHDREVKLAKDRPADDSAGSGNDSPSRSSSPTGRLFFVRRIRHDGDEDVVDKDHVALESYHLSSKSFDGPLDGLPREDDLEKLPLEEHANKYHDGQSWQRGKQKRKVLTPKDSQQSKETSSQEMSQPTDAKKENVLYITRVASEDRTRDGENNAVGHKSRLRLDFGLRWPSWRSGRSSHDGKHVDDVESSEAGSSRATSPRRQLYITRVRHDGDEDEVVQEDLKLASYELPGTPYEGPLEETHLENDLEIVPLGEHCTPYHSGLSYAAAKKLKKKKIKVTDRRKTIEQSEEKSEHEKQAASESGDAGRARVIYLAKVPDASVDEEITEDKRMQVEKTRFNWRFSTARRNQATHGSLPSTSDGYYSETSERYAGPVDTIDRRDELANLPLDVVVNLPIQNDGDVRDNELLDAVGNGKRKRVFLMRRLRHDGEEDVVAKELVKAESYGLPSAPYQGPLESTDRENDLEHASLRDHASVYHDGQSWRLGSSSGKIVSDKGEKMSKNAKKAKRNIADEPGSAQEYDKTEKVIYIAKVESPTEHGATDGTSSTSQRRERNFELRLPHFDWRFGRKSHDREVKLAKDRPADDSAGSGNDSPSRSSSPTGRLFFVRRIRHDGDEDVVDKDHVALESYHLSSKSFDGPLDGLPREDDLEKLPLEEHANKYHDGQSWQRGKQTRKVLTPKDSQQSKETSGRLEETHLENDLEIVPLGKHYTPYHSGLSYAEAKKLKKKKIKVTDRSKTIEQSEEKSEHEKQAASESGDAGRARVIYLAKVPDASVNEEITEDKRIQVEKTRFNWRSSTARRNQATHGSLPSTSDGYYSETSERYAGPVDTIDRRDELANLPLDVVVNLPIQNDGDVRDTELLGAVGNGKRKRVFLMRRLRHDGEEDVVAKELVKAESYGLPSAPYQGPLESTYRENDLEHAPLRDHASVYHDGQSWRLGSSSGKIESDKGEKMSKNAKKAKRNIADEPGSAQEYDKKEKVIYIAKVESPTEHGAIDGTSSTRQRRERNFELRLPHFDWRFGRKSHDREVKLAKDRPADDSAGSGNDSPSRSSSPTGRLFFVRRIRHDGDEDVVDKDHVALESYHLSSKSFDGPLDGLPREDDLEKLPLEEHANKYHDGQSWQRGKQKRKVLTPKDSQQSKETSSQEMSQPTDAKKENVLYITRVASEDRTRDGENNAVGHKSRLRLDFGLRWPSWRSGRSSHDGKHVDDVESSEAGSSRATSPRRQLYITRVRHDGDEDEVVQEDLKLASYELPGTPYEGPLEETHLENDLEIVPLGEHCTPYHSGLSYAAAKKLKKKKIKVTDRRKTIEQSEEKSEHEKQAASESGDAGRARVIYLAKVPDASVDEEITEDKRMQVEKTRFNWRFSTARRNQATHGSLPSTSDGYYSETSERYAGPVDTIDRRDELANLPLDVVVNLPIQNDGDVRDNELLDAVGNGKRKRVFLMRRLRHDGEEDVVAKELVKAESYGLPSAPYQGPLESTDRENDLEHASLRDHASVYHDGQSWRLGSSSGKIVSDKGEKMSKNAKKAKRNIADEPGSAQEYDKTEKVIYIAKVESPTEHGATDGTSSTRQRRERNFELRLPHFDWRFGRKSHDREVKLAKDRPADDSAGSGNDSPSRSSSPTGRLFFVRRIRHDGDEDVVDKDHVALESYHLSSKSFDGPLDGLPREDDLEKLPLEEHANKYHDGQSWQRGKQTRKVLTPKDSQQSKETSGRLEETHLENDLEIVPLGKHYTPYHSGLSYAEAKKLKKKKIKVTDRSKTIEQSEEKSEHEKQAASESGDAGRARVIYLAKVPDASVNEEITEDKRIQVEKTRFNWRFSTARRNQATHGSLPSSSDGYYSETSERYAGPVDTIDRRDELANLPLDVVVNLPIQNDGDVRDTELLGAVGNGKRKRVFLMRRLRHDGEQDVVAKELVKAESYGLPSAPYQGPLESTDRESDLEHAPLRDHASVYHDGQSWRLGSSSGKIESDKGDKMSKNAKNAKRNIADEPGSAQEYDKKEKVIYIAKVESPTEHGATDGTSSTRQRRERNFELRLPHFDWRFGRKSHDREVKLAKDWPADDSAGSGNDSPSRSSSPTGRLFFVRRIRHDGDEDVVDKDHVALESYHLSSKSFDGPLDGLPREDDLEKLPLEEHANKYHDGQSWQRGKQKRKVLTPKDSQQSKETSGRLEETHLENDLEIVPLGEHCTPYHSGLSYAAAKKLKKKKIKVTDRSKTIEQSEEKSEHEKQAASESGDAGRARVIYLAKVPDASVDEEITEDKRMQVEKTRFNWRFSTARRNQATHGSLPSTSNGYYSETSERYAGPVDTIDRRDEFANLPLDCYMSSPMRRALQDITNINESGIGYPDKEDDDHREGIFLADHGRTTNEVVEVRMECRFEVALEPVYRLAGSSGENNPLFSFSVTPPMSTRESHSSFFSRLFHSAKGRDDGGKKWKKQKKEKGKKGAPAEEESSSSSDSSDDVKHEIVVHQIQSLERTVARCEELNACTPEVAHSERVRSVLATGPLPARVSESGEPHTTVASWNETSELPDQVVVEKDEEGNLITRTVKTKHVKHTVQKHTVQNYSVGDNDHPHAVDRLEHCHSELIPTQMTGISPSNLVSTESRSVEYSADRFGQSDENAPGEFVSSKTVTSGNRTVETITYKVEREGVVETHVEHRVTIHSDDDIDHDAELSAAILEATQMNPDMTVEKIEVRQETSS